jgi:hypothetical protein
VARLDVVVDHEASIADGAVSNFMVALPWRTNEQPFSTKLLSRAA